jgi:hypothetical protein
MISLVDLVTIPIVTHKKQIAVVTGISLLTVLAVLSTL